MDYAKFAFKTSLKAYNASSSLLNPKKLTLFENPEKSMWGCSSVGRAPALQAGGQEFDSPHLHHAPALRGREPKGEVGVLEMWYASQREAND